MEDRRQGQPVAERNCRGEETPKSQFYAFKVKTCFVFPRVTFGLLSGEASWSRELRRRGGLGGAGAWQGVHGQVRFDII